MELREILCRFGEEERVFPRFPLHCNAADYGDTSTAWFGFYQLSG
jgi:hypothetical protein